MPEIILNNENLSLDDIYIMESLKPFTKEEKRWFQSKTADEQVDYIIANLNLIQEAKGAFEKNKRSFFSKDNEKEDFIHEKLWFNFERNIEYFYQYTLSILPASPKCSFDKLIELFNADTSYYAKRTYNFQPLFKHYFHDEHIEDFLKFALSMDEKTNKKYAKIQQNIHNIESIVWEIILKNKIEKKRLTRFYETIKHDQQIKENYFNFLLAFVYEPSILSRIMEFEKDFFTNERTQETVFNILYYDMLSNEAFMNYVLNKVGALQRELFLSHLLHFLKVGKLYVVRNEHELLPKIEETPLKNKSEWIRKIFEHPNFEKTLRIVELPRFANSRSFYIDVLAYMASKNILPSPFYFEIIPNHNKNIQCLYLAFLYSQHNNYPSSLYDELKDVHKSIHSFVKCFQVFKQENNRYKKELVTNIVNGFAYHDMLSLFSSIALRLKAHGIKPYDSEKYFLFLDNVNTMVENLARQEGFYNEKPETDKVKEKPPKETEESDYYTSGDYIFGKVGIDQLLSSPKDELTIENLSESIEQKITPNDVDFLFFKEDGYQSKWQFDEKIVRFAIFAFLDRIKERWEKTKLVTGIEKETFEILTLYYQRYRKQLKIALENISGYNTEDFERLDFFKNKNREGKQSEEAEKVFNFIQLFNKRGL